MKKDIVKLNIYQFDVSSHELLSVDTTFHPSIEDAKQSAVAHNWEIAWNNSDTDYNLDEYVNTYSWDDLDYLQYDNYGYEIEG